VTKSEEKLAAKQLKEEKKAKRAKKDKNAPKKPMSAFFCYQTQRRKDLKNEQPNLNHKDIVKRMTDEWKAMTDADKHRYDLMKDQQKERYEKEMREYKKK